MFALDTNAIIRFLVRDDEKQSRIIYKRLKKAEDSRERLYISLLVMLEVIWVLESAYSKSRNEIIDSIEAMRAMSLFSFEDEGVISLIIESGRSTNLDLSDLLIAHAAESSGCESVLTFDKKASKHSLFQLLK